MRLDFHRSGRRRPGRELRVEGPDNAIRTLRRKSGSGVEEPEVARVRHVHDAVLQLRDAPGEQLVKRARRAKIEAGELALEGGKIERWYHRSLRDARIGLRQLTREKII